MKKAYTKPMIEIETYALNASIAANCGNVINLGPGIPGSEEYLQCDSFKDSGFLMNINPEYSINSKVTPFYSDGAKNCDCYYTSGNMGYFTS